MTTLNNMDHTERADSSLRFILQNNNRPPFELAIDPDTGEYGYKKVGADSVTPFKSITNITANIDSTESVNISASFWVGTPSSSTGPRSYTITKDGLFAGGVACGTQAGWFQGNGYPATAGHKAIYYPPDGSSSQEFVLVDTSQGISNVGDQLIAVEAGGHIDISTWFVSGDYGGGGSVTLTGIMIYLKE